MVVYVQMGILKKILPIEIVFCKINAIFLAKIAKIMMLPFVLSVFLSSL